MKNLTFEIRGTSALLMQSDKLANPLDPIARKIKTFSGKKTKTEEDYLAMSRLEFEGAMNWHESTGPFIKGEQIDRTILDAARLTKKGKQVERGLVCTQERVPLIYEGPRDIERMFADVRFVDMRTVVVGRARVVRTRPIFYQWGCTFDLLFDEGLLNKVDVKGFVETAGKYCGLGTFRRRFGRFEVVGG